MKSYFALGSKVGVNLLEAFYDKKTIHMLTVDFILEYLSGN